MTTFMRRMLVLAGLAGTFAFTPAFSQSSEGILEEIIVTAERREAGLQEVPIAVTALSMQRIEHLQVIQAQDLQRYVPSLNMFNNITSPTNLQLSMRGGLQQDASLAVAESPVGIYVDDIFVGRLNGNDVVVADAERIEVLRGPQGTLYGRNTAYGAIKFVSRTPDEDPWFEAFIAGGNYDQLRFGASVGGPLGDNWAGSLAGQWIEKDGQYFNAAKGVETDLQENLSLRGKLRYMGEVFDGQLMVAYSNSENDSLQMVNGVTPTVQSDCRPGTPGFVQPCVGGVNAQFTTEDLVFPNGLWTTNTAWGNAFPPPAEVQPPPLEVKPRGETEHTIVGLTLAWDFNDNMTFKSITGYVGVEDFFHTDFSGNSAVFGATRVDSDQFTQEIQFLGTAINDRLKYVFGAFYLHEEADQPWGWNLGTAQPVSQTMIDLETDSIAVFGDASYNFTDNLRVSAGLRWTNDDKQLIYDFTGFLIPIPQPTINLDIDSDEWTPRAVIEYTFGDSGIMAYGSAARGFKGAGFSALAIFTAAPVGVYEPETNWTYAAGLKADWLDDRLRTNLEYFFSDIEDIVQISTDASNPGIIEFPVQNSADAEIQGFEFEISAVPVPNLNVWLIGSFMDGEYKNLNPESSAAAAPVIYGVEPQTPQTPDYAFDIGFDYTINLPGQLFDSLSFGADYYEIDDYITASTNDFLTSGWDLWNGFVKLTMAERWELMLTGKNLGDEANVTSGDRTLGGFVFLPPREYLFQVTYRL